MKRNLIITALAATAMMASAATATATVRPACEVDGVSLAISNFNPDRLTEVRWSVAGPVGSGVLARGTTVVQGSQLLGVPVVNTVPLTVTITFGPDPVRDVRTATLGPCPGPVPTVPTTPTVPGPTVPPVAPEPPSDVPARPPVTVVPPPPVVVLPPPPGGPDRPPVTCATLRKGGASLATLRRRGCIRLARCPRGKVPVFVRRGRTWTSVCVVTTSTVYLPVAVTG